MRRLLAVLTLLACSVPAFAQVHYFRSDIEQDVTVVDDGNDQYSLKIGTLTRKALTYTINGNTHRAALAANVGSAYKPSFGYAHYGPTSGSEQYHYITRSPVSSTASWLLIVLDYTGTVTKDAPGKFQLTVNGQAFKVAFHASAFYAGVPAFDAAATSGDPINVYGLMCERGKAGQPGHEKWFVVEKLP